MYAQIHSRGAGAERMQHMSGFESQLLEMIRNAKDPEAAIEITVKVILDFLTLPRSSE